MFSLSKCKKFKVFKHVDLKKLTIFFPFFALGISALFIFFISSFALGSTLFFKTAVKGNHFGDFDHFPIVVLFYFLLWSLSFFLFLNTLVWYHFNLVDFRLLLMKLKFTNLLFLFIFLLTTRIIQGNTLWILTLGLLFHQRHLFWSHFGLRMTFALHFWILKFCTIFLFSLFFSF